jgi:hypothetical protein
MRITYKDFLEYINAGGFHKVGLHAVPRAHMITTQYFCDKLTLRSACSGNCGPCIKALKDRLNTTTWDNANPYALFTHVVKSTYADVMEKQRVVEKPAQEKNFLGEAVEVDALDLLLETLS